MLAAAGENLLVVSGVADPEVLRRLLPQVDNAVILKAYRGFGEIRRALSEMDAADRALFVSRLGMEGELVCRDLDQAPEAPHYLSLVLVPAERRKPEKCPGTMTARNTAATPLRAPENT